MISENFGINNHDSGLNLFKSFHPQIELDKLNEISYIYAFVLGVSKSGVLFITLA